MQLTNLFVYTEMFLLLMISVELIVCTASEKSNILLTLLAITKLSTNLLYIWFIGTLDFMSVLMVTLCITILTVLISDYAFIRIKDRFASNHNIKLFKYSYLLLLIALPIMIVLIVSYLLIYKSNILFSFCAIISIACLWYKAVVIFATLMVSHNRFNKEIGV